MRPTNSLELVKPWKMPTENTHLSDFSRLSNHQVSTLFLPPQIFPKLFPTHECVQVRSSVLSEVILLRRLLPGRGLGHEVEVHRVHAGIERIGRF
jgi:hypothetical protein